MNETVNIETPIWLNHRLVTREKALIPVSDRAFRLGDGIFETIAMPQGLPYQWRLHLRRIEDGLATLRLPLDVSRLLPACKAVVEAAPQEVEGMLRITISRGSGGTGYLPLPEDEQQPTLVVEWMPRPEPVRQPVVLWLSEVVKPSPLSMPSFAKTINALPYILARLEAREQGCFEALMCDAQGDICEAASGNIVWLKEGVLHTPPISGGCLPGTTREAVLRLSPWPVKETLCIAEKLESAEAVCLLNTNWRALPVSGLEPIGLQWDSKTFAKQLCRLIEKDASQEATLFLREWQAA